MHNPTTRGKDKAIVIVPIAAALVFVAALVVVALLSKFSEGEAVPLLSCGCPRAANKDAGLSLPSPWTTEEDEDNSEQRTSKAQRVR